MLWDVMAIKLKTDEQGLFQISPAVKSGFLQQLVDAAIEPFHHAVSF